MAASLLSRVTRRAARLPGPLLPATRHMSRTENRGVLRRHSQGRTGLRPLRARRSDSLSHVTRQVQNQRGRSSALAHLPSTMWERWCNAAPLQLPWPMPILTPILPATGSDSWHVRALKQSVSANCTLSCWWIRREALIARLSTDRVAPVPAIHTPLSQSTAHKPFFDRRTYMSKATFGSSSANAIGTRSLSKLASLWTFLLTFFFVGFSFSVVDDPHMVVDPARGCTTALRDVARWRTTRASEAGLRAQSRTMASRKRSAIKIVALTDDEAGHRRNHTDAHARIQYNNNNNNIVVYNNILLLHRVCTPHSNSCLGLHALRPSTACGASGSLRLPFRCVHVYRTSSAQ